MIKWIENHPIISIIGAVAAMLLFHLDVFHITIMEARNFITAREMVEDGHWLLTTMNGEPRYEKPPLPTWFSAIFGSLLGMKSLFALRLPAVLMIMTTGVMTYLISLKMVQDRSQSLMNGMIVITSFYVVGIIIEAPWDIFTHGFMLIAIYFLYRLFQAPTNIYLHGFLAGIFLGFSFMSKGPISLYALLLPFLISYGWVYGYAGLRTKWKAVTICLYFFAMTGLWWYVYVRFQDPISFEAITSKETSNWANYNVKPFYHYWSFFIQSGIWTVPALIALLYPYMKSRVSNLKAYRFTILWTIVAVVLLSLIPEKKNRYLMPVLIPLAMTTGFYMEYAIREFSKIGLRERLPVYFYFGLVALIGIILPVAGFLFYWDQFQGYEWLFSITSLVSIVIGIFILRSLIHSKIQNAFYQTILFLVALLGFGTPLSKTLYSDTFHPIANHQQIIEEVHYYGEIAPEFVWYYGRPIPLIDPKDLLGKPTEDEWQILVDSGNIASFEASVSNEYHLEIVETYNLNRMARQRDRLIAHLYHLKTRK